MKSIYLFLLLLVTSSDVAAEQTLGDLVQSVSLVDVISPMLSVAILIAGVRVLTMGMRSLFHLMDLQAREEAAAMMSRDQREGETYEEWSQRHGLN